MFVEGALHVRMLHCLLQDRRGKLYHGKHTYKIKENKLLSFAILCIKHHVCGAWEKRCDACIANLFYCSECKRTSRNLRRDATRRSASDRKGRRCAVISVHCAWSVCYIVNNKMWARSKWAKSKSKTIKMRSLAVFMALICSVVFARCVQATSMHSNVFLVFPSPLPLGMDDWLQQTLFRCQTLIDFRLFARRARSTLYTILGAANLIKSNSG